MRHSLRIVSAFLLAGAAACDSPTGEKPRDLPPLAADAPVQGRLDLAAADSFALVAPGGEFRVLLRAASGSATDSLVVSVLTDAGTVIASARSVGTDTDPAAQATGWLLPPPEARWRVEVRGHSPNDGGAYTLQLFVRNAAPERVAAALTPGQAVTGELLDVPGDVDEFTVEGAAGDEWILFAQSDAPVRMELVERTSGQVVATAMVDGPTPALESRSSGRVVLPRAGTYVVRVSATAGAPDVRGPYRFRLDRVNRAPEAGAAAVSLGDVLTESIGTVGDVDEYTFTATPGQEINLMVQLQHGMSTGLRVQLLRFEQLLAEVEGVTPNVPLDEQGTGRRQLEAGGAYTVRVFGAAEGAPEAATGGYRVELYPVDRRVEAGGQVRLDGPAVEGAIDRSGDIDEYQVSGTAGQLVVVYASRGEPVGGDLQAVLLAPNGTALPPVTVGAHDQPRYSMRASLPVTGTYVLRVAAPQAGMTGRGPFTVGVYTIDPAPEHVPATLTLGQTVTTERIDRPGDLDVFTFTGQAGRMASVFVGAPENAPGFPVNVRRASDPTSFIFTFAGTMAMDGRNTGRIALENTGYVVTVDPQSLSGGESQYSYAGPYGLRLFEIDRSPEGVPTAYVLGDTVKTEPLYPSGDVDDYRFTLAATTSLHVFWAAPSGDPATVVWGQLYNEDAGGIVWTNFNSTSDGPVRDIILPAGRYRLAVSNINLNAPSQTAQFGVPRLNYRFALIPR